MITKLHPLGPGLQIKEEVEDGDHWLYVEGSTEGRFPCARTGVKSAARYIRAFQAELRAGANIWVAWRSAQIA